MSRASPYCPDRDDRQTRKQRMQAETRSPGRQQRSHGDRLASVVSGARGVTVPERRSAKADGSLAPPPIRINDLARYIPDNIPAPACATTLTQGLGDHRWGARPRPGESGMRESVWWPGGHRRHRTVVLWRAPSDEGGRGDGHVVVASPRSQPLHSPDSPRKLSKNFSRSSASQERLCAWMMG